MTVKRGTTLQICTGLMLFLLVLQVDGQPQRRRRDIWQLSKVLSCATGKNFFQITWRYLNYGCWCGVRGSGKPVDRIDW
ncbi:hypothetical protein chiPu_0009529 [Chiloscyllium punctatum]|uniref:Phospholipase A2-like central domain-containing protein n=1 Tax=Chiloscyllium punctatum TaxID=137246 RepID=A0A401SL12_CHIPU|nr:hypothetical protein [Chiloscyllium punctatum]